MKCRCLKISSQKEVVCSIAKDSHYIGAMPHTSDGTSICYLLAANKHQQGPYTISVLNNSQPLDIFWTNLRFV